MRGYAMFEVLIATAIAAAILLATAGVIGGIVQLYFASTERTQTLHEATLIAARLRAGMEEQDVIDGLSDWRIERRPFDGDDSIPFASTFEITVAYYGNDEYISFEFLTVKKAAQS